MAVITVALYTLEHFASNKSWIRRVYAYTVVQYMYLRYAVY